MLRPGGPLSQSLASPWAFRAPRPWRRRRSRLERGEGHFVWRLLDFLRAVGRLQHFGCVFDVCHGPRPHPCHQLTAIACECVSSWTVRPRRLRCCLHVGFVALCEVLLQASVSPWFSGCVRHLGRVTYVSWTLGFGTVYDDGTCRRPGLLTCHVWSIYQTNLDRGGYACSHGLRCLSHHTHRHNVASDDVTCTDRKTYQIP